MIKYREGSRECVLCIVYARRVCVYVIICTCARYARVWDMNIKISIKATPLITAYVTESKPINRRRRRASRQLSLQRARATQHHNNIRIIVYTFPGISKYIYIYIYIYEFYTRAHILARYIQVYSVFIYR